LTQEGRGLKKVTSKEKEKSVSMVAGGGGIKKEGEETARRGRGV